MRLKATLFIFLVAVSAGAQQSSHAKVDAIFEKWDTPDSPGCALSVIRDGAITYKRGYGMANLEYGIPITPSSIFHVASVSKHFTVMAILLLSREGKLSRRGAPRALRLRISNRLSPSVQTDPSHHRLNDSLDVGHEPHRSHQSESPNPCVRKRVGEQRCGGKKRRPLRDNIIDDRNVAGID